MEEEWKHMDESKARPWRKWIFSRKLSLFYWLMEGPSLERYDQPRENRIKHIKRTEAFALNHGPDAGIEAGYRFRSNFKVHPHRT